MSTMRDKRAALGNPQRFPKPTLLAILRHEQARAGSRSYVPRVPRKGTREFVDTGACAFSADPRIRWTRDELIGSILDVVYPDVCHWHDQAKPCTGCTA